MESMTLISTAEDAERMGKPGVAANLYQQALDEYPNSVAAQHARAALARLRSGHAPTTAQAVTVIDIRMPFLSMVVFLVKVSVAAIPAIIILSLLGLLLGVLLPPLGLAILQ